MCRDFANIPGIKRLACLQMKDGRLVAQECPAESVWSRVVECCAVTDNQVPDLCLSVRFVNRCVEYFHGSVAHGRPQRLPTAH
jgi:hypothetical protein